MPNLKPHAPLALVFGVTAQFVAVWIFWGEVSHQSDSDALGLRELQTPKPYTLWV